METFVQLACLQLCQPGQCFSYEMRWKTFIYSHNRRHQTTTWDPQTLTNTTHSPDFHALLHMTTTVASLYPSAHELLAGESLEVQRFHKLYFGFRGRKLTRLQLICEPGHCEARNPFRDFWFCNIFAWLSTSLKYCRSLHFFISYLKTNWL